MVGATVDTGAGVQARARRVERFVPLGGVLLSDACGVGLNTPMVARGLGALVPACPKSPFVP